MRRLLFALLLSLLVIVPVRAAYDWAIVAEKLRDSIVSIETKDGRCSGFVIDDARDFVLAAAHCDGDELYVDMSPAKVRAKDVKNDIMVLFVEGIDRPALTMAARNPRVGDEVASYGFGWGLERPFFRVAHVSDVKTVLPGVEGGPFIVVDAAFVPGQSGCPVVNTRGEVVSVVQLGSANVGLGVGVDKIREKVGKYFTGK